MNLKKTAKNLDGTLNFIARKLDPTGDRIIFVDTNRFSYCLTSMAKSGLMGGIAGAALGYLMGEGVSIFAGDEIMPSAITTGTQIGIVLGVAFNSLRTLGLMNMKRENLYSYEAHRRDLFRFLNNKYN